MFSRRFQQKSSTMAEYFNQLRRLLQVQGESFEEDVRNLVIYLRCHSIETSKQGSGSSSRSILTTQPAVTIFKFASPLVLLLCRDLNIYFLGYQYSTPVSSANSTRYQPLPASYRTYLHQK